MAAALPPSRPTALVALMSAAGLGLTLPGMAAASTDAVPVVQRSQADADDVLAQLHDHGYAPAGNAGYPARLAVEDRFAYAADPAIQPEALAQTLALIAGVEFDGDEKPRASLVLVAMPQRPGDSSLLAQPQAADRSRPPAAGDDGSAARAKRVQRSVPHEPDRDVARVDQPNRFAAGSQPAGVAAAPLVLSALDQTLAALAEVLGAGSEEQARPADEYRSAATNTSEPAFQASLAEGTATSSTSTQLGSPRVDRQDWLARQLTAKEVEVLPHENLVLRELAHIRGGLQEDGPSSYANEAGKKFVATQEEKVLELLGVIRTLERPAADQVTLDRAQSPSSPPTASSPVAAAPPPDSAQLAQSPTSPPTPTVLQTEEAPSSRPARSALGSETTVVGADRLEAVRGGFVTDTGLKISFGIERAVYINGNLVTTTSLNVAELSRTAAGASSGTVPASNGTLALLQSGAGNTFTAVPTSPSSVGTVVQNRLDNQQISAVTRINAVVNSASIMRSLNLQSSLRSATIDALRR